MHSAAKRQARHRFEKRPARKAIYNRRDVLDQVITSAGHADAARLMMDDPPGKRSSDRALSGEAIRHHNNYSKFLQYNYQEYYS
jgi:hypothetical protein